MSDTPSSADGGWADAWMQMQRQYWKTWSDLSTPASGQRAEKTQDPRANPWAQGLDWWSKMLAPALSGDSRDGLGRLLEMNKAYVQMGESLWQAMSAGTEARSDIKHWWETVSRTVQAMQQQALSGTPATQDPWSGFATCWGLPLDTWRRVSSACSMFPGDMEKAFRDTGVPRAGDTLPGLLSGWLSTPTLGYTRESQEEFQRWGQCLLAYQEAMQNYAGVLAGVVARAAELLRDKALERTKNGEVFEGLRECYNLWVDCGEEAYAEVCVSDEFTHAQAAMTNALMALKRQEQAIIDEGLSALNMPTRRELDTSHRRVHQLQRRVWRMEEVLDSAGVRELREEVAALREELQTLRKAEPAPAAPTAAARRSSKVKSES